MENKPDTSTPKIIKGKHQIQNSEIENIKINSEKKFPEGGVPEFSKSTKNQKNTKIGYIFKKPKFKKKFFEN